MAPKNLPKATPDQARTPTAPLLVDENLIGLARWLRFFGLDTSMAVGWKDREVAAFARRKRRLLITRDVHLARSMAPDPVLRVESDQMAEQLKTVLRAVGVPGEDRWFTRCVRCNTPLREYAAEETAADPTVPGDISEQAAEPVWHCDRCHRSYWRGSHYRRTRDFLLGVSETVRAGNA